VRIAVISDTHLPRGARRVPESCVEAMRESDLILHAGDLSTLEVLDWLVAIGPPVRAVHGNVDSADVRERLPESDLVEAEGRRIGLIHDAGPAKGRLDRMRRRFPEAEAVVFGHSHLPLYEEADGFQIFNPGSPTERRRAPSRAYGMAVADPGGLRFQHVWLA
jgi:putative phosphoesterase